MTDHAHGRRHQGPTGIRATQNRRFVGNGPRKTCAVDALPANQQVTYWTNGRAAVAYLSGVMLPPEELMKVNGQ